MNLYHGSTYIVENPSLEILNFKTDFGKGFYTTTDLEQAKRWTQIKKKRLKELNSAKGYINNRLQSIDYGVRLISSRNYFFLCRSGQSGNFISSIQYVVIKK